MSNMNDELDLRDLGKRYETFNSPNWTVRRTIIQPGHLATAGFSYTGQRDAVKCAYCELVLSNWRSDHDAWLRHKRHSPNCRHVKSHFEQQDTGNHLHAIGPEASSPPSGLEQQGAAGVDYGRLGVHVSSSNERNSQGSNLEKSSIENEVRIFELFSWTRTG